MTHLRRRARTLHGHSAGGRRAAVVVLRSLAAFRLRFTLRFLARLFAAGLFLLGEQLVKFADVVARERSFFRKGDNMCCFVICCPCCPGADTPWHTCWGLPIFGQQWCERMTAFPSGEFMAFYDFASLHQKDPETGGRTGEEKTAFDSALGSTASADKVAKTRVAIPAYGPCYVLTATLRRQAKVYRVPWDRRSTLPSSRP